MTVASICPPEALASSMFLENLSVNVPVGAFDGNSVVIPPIADGSEPLIESIGNTMALTNEEGTRVLLRGEAVVGWDGNEEADARAGLRTRRNAISSMLGSGGGRGLASSAPVIHPSVRPGVTNLLRIAMEKLDTIEQIYAAWENGILPADQGGVIRMGLRTPFENMWGQVMFPSNQFGANLLPTFQQLAPVLGNERGGWDSTKTAQPSYGQMRAAIVAARTRDRNTIRRLMDEAFRAIYCSEYGLAQSESYLANKAQYDDSRPQTGGFALTGEKPPTPPSFGGWGDDESESGSSTEAEFVPTIPVPVETNEADTWRRRANIGAGVAALGLTTLAITGVVRGWRAA